MHPADEHEIEDYQDAVELEVASDDGEFDGLDFGIEEKKESSPHKDMEMPDNMEFGDVPEIEVEVDQDPSEKEPRQTENITREMFTTLAALGQGAYGVVELVKKKNTGVKYALKVLEKDHILKYDKIESVFRERDLGQELSGHPNVVEFQATFQDAENLYFLLEYC